MMDMAALGGMPPGGGGGGGMPGGPEGGQNPMAEMGIAALSGLNPKQANPTAGLAKVEEALKLAYQLINSALPQVSQWNPKAAKDLHAISKQLLAAQMDLKKEGQPGPPPPMMGMGGGMPAGGTPTGAPFGMPSGQF